jgi:hypothetical protein
VFNCCEGLELRSRSKKRGMGGGLGCKEGYWACSSPSLRGARVVVVVVEVHYFLELLSRCCWACHAAVALTSSSWCLSCSVTLVLTIVVMTSSRARISGSRVSNPCQPGRMTPVLHAQNHADSLRQFLGFLYSPPGGCISSESHK